MAEQNSRIYHLTDGTSQWLVRATNKAQAMSFIVRQRIRCEVADQETLIALVAKNYTVGDATGGAASAGADAATEESES